MLAFQENPTQQVPLQPKPVSMDHPLLLEERDLHDEPFMVYMLDGATFQRCACFVTNYRVQLSTKGKGMVGLPRSAIMKIGTEKVGTVHQYLNDSSQAVQIYCKNGWSVYLRCDSATVEEQNNFKKLLALLHDAVAEDFKQRFCLQTTKTNESWYSFKAETARILGGDPSMFGFRITTVNHDYSVSASYPQHSLVPIEATDDLIRKHSEFRAKGRFVSISWVHKVSMACLARSSQPLVGLKKIRSEADEEMLSLLRPKPHTTQAKEKRNGQNRRRAMTEVQHLTQFNIRDGTTHHNTTIIDLRPWKNAAANMAKGGGYECSNLYNCTYINGGMEDCHVIQASLEGLQKLSRSEPNAWRSDLLNTRWLDHLELLVKCSVTCLSQLLSGGSVLVHCTNGWDRTAQVVSLTMLLLDPFYRTFEGFQILVQKEWTEMGHRFSSRCGNGPTGAAKDLSPIFLQFLDAVYQVMTLYPTAFEFSDTYLESLADHVYSCRYGDFLFDTQQQRVEARITEDTRSVWTFLSSRRSFKAHCNLLYTPSAILNPEGQYKKFCLWGYYLRYDFFWNSDCKQEALTMRKIDFLDFLEKRTHSVETGSTDDDEEFYKERFPEDEPASGWPASPLERGPPASLPVDAEPRRGVFFATADVRWIPDTLAHSCSFCKNPFFWYRRRHHCRSCGRVFCSKCSSGKVYLPTLGHNTEKVRVCDFCRRRNTAH
eukprot:TRINITY_DN5717_c1_g2_i1.p1 TRINITY_DN5717_c1_g2~~TRINITY_DN5717_c1_g2_i1.p1  ORF type:complete len:727 (+),score=91.29 TRINITY_DN5717_c1_g2_i1:47-2182(+)